MKTVFISMFITIFCITPPLAAIDCSNLKNEKELRMFLEQTRLYYPLTNPKISGQLKVSPCEKEECLKQNRKKRDKKKMVLHSFRIGEEKRTYFIKGENAPMCVVTKGIRKYKCEECGPTFNDQCRSFNSKTSIEGTNLDTIDMKLLGSEDYKNQCKPYAKSNKFFRVTSTQQGGTPPYNRIESFFEKKRGIPIKINYYADNVLRKVYRFSAKQFTPFGKSWMANKIKVRSTQGSEKNYTFETLIQIHKKQGKYLLYDSLGKDPYLKKTSMDILLSTN